MYPVHIKNQLFQNVASEISPYCIEHKVFVLSDNHVAPLYYAGLKQQFRAQGRDTTLFTVQAGEGAKTLAVASNLYRWLLEEGASRHSLLLNLGGGVVSDLGGYVAATFMRGCHYINIPTTLLAQIDAAIGSKTAVNFENTKNIIGTFYDPQAVLIDPSLLDTLPERERQNGKGEMLKYAILMGDRLIQRIYHSPQVELEAIKECVNYKLALVSQDKHDMQARLKLNCGHTIGHALEAYFPEGSLAHGEAVALGCLAATKIAQALGVARSTFGQELKALMQHLKLPLTLPVDRPLNIENVMHLIKRDKKRQANGQIKWILPTEWGEVTMKVGLPDKLIHQVIHSLR